MRNQGTHFHLHLVDGVDLILRRKPRIRGQEAKVTPAGWTQGGSRLIADELQEGQQDWLALSQGPKVQGLDGRVG